MFTHIMMAATVLASGAITTTGGVAPVDSVRMQVSDRSISTIRLDPAHALLGVSVSDPSLVEVQVVSDGIVAVTGDPGPAGVHMLLRRSGRSPLDVHLVPSRGAVSSTVLDVDGASSTSRPAVRRWNVSGSRVSQLSPGFPIRSALRTGAAQVAGLSDGAFVTSGANGDVVAYGEHDEVAIYHMR